MKKMKRKKLIFFLASTAILGGAGIISDNLVTANPVDSSSEQQLAFNRTITVRFKSEKRCDYLIPITLDEDANDQLNVMDLRKELNPKYPGVNFHQLQRAGNSKNYVVNLALAK